MGIEDDWKTTADWVRIYPQLIKDRRSEEDLEKELIKQSKAKRAGILSIGKKCGFRRNVVLALVG